MAYLLKFDSDVPYTFPATFYPADRSLDNVIPSAPLPRTHGARQLTGYKGQRRLTVRGGFVGPNQPFGGVADFQEEIDDLLESLNSGPGDLYFGEDGWRYRCVQWERFGEPYDPTYWDEILAGGEIVFVTGDPFRYKVPADEAEAASWSDTWTAPVDGDLRTINIGTVARAGAAPDISIEVGGVGSQAIEFVLANNTTGESFSLAGTVTGGDVIVLESLLKTVKIGSTDMRTLFEGQHLTFKKGANQLELTINAGSIASILTEWIPRKN